MRHTYIVSYDIADPKRLRKVFRICQDTGIISCIRFSSAI